jgi:hypothetical protein
VFITDIERGISVRIGTVTGDKVNHNREPKGDAPRKGVYEKSAIERQIDGVAVASLWRSRIVSLWPLALVALVVTGIGAMTEDFYNHFLSPLFHAPHIGFLDSMLLSVSVFFLTIIVGALWNIVPVMGAIKVMGDLCGAVVNSVECIMEGD